MEVNQLTIRGIQFLWIILLIALLGNVIARGNAGSLVSDNAVNFSLFVTVVSWAANMYGFAIALSADGRIAVPMAVMAAEGLVLLFTFVDAIVLAATLGAPNCSHVPHEGTCRELQASAAFMWFLFFTYGVSAAFAFLGYRQTVRGSGPARPAGPHMSQVGV